MSALRTKTRQLSIAACALAGLLAVAAPASATTVELNTYKGVYPTGSFNGADAIGSSAFSSLDHVAIDQVANRVYAGASGQVYKFDFDGVSQGFSGLGGNSVIPKSSGEYGDIEVDNSGTATQGRIYVADDSSSFDGYSPEGTQLPGFPVSNGGETCGVAVGPDGHVWANNYSNTVKEYDATTNPPTLLQTISFSPATGGLCDFDIDNEGNFLVPDSYGGGPVYKYNPSGTSRVLIDSASSRSVAVDPSNNHIYVVAGNFVDHLSPSGALIDTFGLPEGAPAEYPGLQGARGLAVDGDTHAVYVANKRNPHRIDIFAPTGPVVIPTVTTDPPEVQPTSAVLHGVVDADGVDTTDCQFEWGPIGNPDYGSKAPCSEGTVFTGPSGAHPVTRAIAGLAKGSTYHFRLVSKNANGILAKGADRVFTASGAPAGVFEGVSKVNTDGVEFNVTIDPNGGFTDYHVEWGEEAGVYGNVFPEPDGQLETNDTVESFSQTVNGLAPGTEYHFRLVAENDAGLYEGPDRAFSTYPRPISDDQCDNALVRKQTGAALLPDCRAYELVSAANAGGYDVRSDLIAGQAPLVAQPQAADALLYSLNYGKIPDIAGEPTNLGSDPYVARRTPSGWSTGYSGIDVGDPPSQGPFDSTPTAISADLSTLAFGGPGSCSPCFADGKTGIPVHRPNGVLVQGMAGGMDPGPAAAPDGFVAQRLSADGSHLIFGSSSKFQADASSTGDVSIYSRDLGTGLTTVVSKDDGGANLACLQGAGNCHGPGNPHGIGSLGVSGDGSRTVVAQRVSTDAAGNDYWTPYMHLAGSGDSVALAPTSTTGVLWGGMTADGSAVLYSSAQKLTGDDHDNSADLFRASVSAGGAVSVSRVSTGAGAGDVDACDPVAAAGRNNWNAVGAASANTCGAVAFAGGAGFSAGDGTAYFLSPEKLDGSGTLNEPNLFVARPGQAPQFVATLEPANPAITHAVTSVATHSYADFQVTPSGEEGLFASRLALTGYPTFDHYALYRWSDSRGLECASCAPTGAPVSGDTLLSGYGSNLADDGRVFFTTGESLALRDSSSAKDVYEWDDGVTSLLSTGRSNSDAGLVTVGADGVNAYFYTRESLVGADRNGETVKVYTARENGGFIESPQSVPCQASDECHGPGSGVLTTATSIGTFKGTGGNYKQKKIKKHKKKKHKKKKKKGGRKGKGKQKRGDKRGGRR
jgi:hypothetical protein